jgi:hypothetical protein
MIGHFQIGFANRKLGLTLPDKNRKAGEELRGRLQRLGILRESGHEHFNGSVVIPVIDHMGQSPGAITEMYRDHLSRRQWVLAVGLAGLAAWCLA